MTKAKPKKKRSTAAPDGIPIEPISLAELSRRAGVSRAAVTLWVKKQNEEMGGDGLFIDDGPVNPRHPSRKVNALDPTILAYINDTFDRGKDRSGNREGQAANGTGAKSRYTAQKLIEFARGLEIKNAEIKGQYSRRDFAFLYFDTELQFAKNHIGAYSAKVCRAIEKELFTAKMTKEQKKLITNFRADIDKELQGVYVSLDRYVSDFKRDNPLKYEEITEAANAPADY
ncbi:hypothetical protein AGMMS49942_30070 [Spirochaetia bacterium]|nr:hypothetical protein AGMMS49942_30070 [Spirochaetia bacterium]